MKNIAKALNQERELYADLANTLPSGIYRLRVFHDVSLIDENWTSAIDTPYVVEFANDRFYEILNLDRIGFEKNAGIINNVIYEDDKKEFAKKNVEANLNVIPFSWEGRLVINSNLMWIQFKSIPRVLENGDIIWTGTLNDISERKNAELEIVLKNRELQKLNADKDRFIKILGHDLNNSFSNILGFSELLTEDIHNLSKEEIADIATNINKSALFTNKLLKDILLWTRTQQGMIPFAPQNLSLKRICIEAVESLKPNAVAKKIALNCVAPGSINVYSDIDMFKTILRNLVSNAIKFTNTGGKITINAKQNSKNIIISVSDDGVGIPPENLTKLFDISEVLTTKGTASETGTGLGLLLCKEFVEKHQGKIWVESEVGKGSDFKFSLPLFYEKTL